MSVWTPPFLSDTAVDDRESPQAGDGIVCGLSGWFTPHGVRYCEHIQSVSKIDPANWLALPEHAGSIDSFEQLEPAPAGPTDLVIHLRLTIDGRSRELTIDDPDETPALARLISFVRRALADREVVTAETMSGEMAVRLVASLRNRKKLRTDCWSWKQD